MATIDELMEGRKPGEIKIISPDVVDESYFVPFFRDQAGLWNGLDAKGRSRYYNNHRKNWEIYTEQKPKKILYEIMGRYKQRSIPINEGWYLSLRLFDEKSFENLCDDDVLEYRKTGRTFEVDDD